MKRLISTTLAMGIVALSGIGNCSDAQQVVVGKAVAANQQVSMDQIDHSVWNQLLQAFVNKKGEVDYKSWKASGNATQALDAYLNTLSTASRTANASKKSQLAFWINAYNAVTVKGILREYPTTTIRNHTSKVGGYNIWNDLLLVVGDTQISLDSMEHKVLRPMGEPRVHFAIVCASYSCPRLLNQAYTAQGLDEELTHNTKNFFANQENFQFDSRSNQFRLSAILSWFGKDFGKDQAERLATIAPYLPTREAYDAAINNRVRVSYLEYDWSLNEPKNSGSQNRRQGSNRR